MAHILVVEDDKAIRFCYEKFISGLGHKAVLTESFSEAKKQVEERVFEVAVVDIVLQKKDDGLNVLKLFSKLQPLCQVIIITGYPSLHISVNAHREGAYYFAKPVRRERFCESVEFAVKRNHLKKEELRKKIEQYKMKDHSQTKELHSTLGEESFSLMVKRQNCWEFKGCERAKGGSKIDMLGTCPASTSISCNGLNNGKNGGRICWAIAGTMCGGKVQGTFAQKLLTCLRCDFYEKVRAEEAPGDFRLLKPGQKYEPSKLFVRRNEDV